MQNAEKELENVAVILDKFFGPVARALDCGREVDANDLDPMQTCMAELMQVWFRLRPASSDVGLIMAAAAASNRRAEG